MYGVKLLMARSSAERTSVRKVRMNKSLKSVSYKSCYKSLLLADILTFYAPNFGKVEGAYCFGLILTNKN